MRTELSLDLIYLGGARVSWGPLGLFFHCMALSVTVEMLLSSLLQNLPGAVCVNVPGTFLFLSRSAAACLCHACRCVCDFWGTACDCSIPVTLLLGVWG